MKKSRITFVTPQFERLKNDAVPASPPEDWEALRGLNVLALKELGLRPWNDPAKPDPDDNFNGKTLMLLPGEWYRYIPGGFEIVGIWGVTKTFEPGVTDNDIRYGCLAYGILA